MDVAVCLPMKVSMSGTSQSRAGETPQGGKRPEGSVRGQQKGPLSLDCNTCKPKSHRKGDSLGADIPESDRVS